MDLVSLLVPLVSGAAGGNMAGSLLKSSSLGVLGNSLAGIVGGGLGGQILNNALGVTHVAATSGIDVGTIVSQMASGGVGGGAMMMTVGVLQSLLSRG